jgi:type IV pilus assembly protein PilX
MTLLALASMRGTILEERMGANMLDRSLAFQAAEAALREAESVAKTKPTINAGCTAGLCFTPDPTVAAQQQRWLGGDAFWSSAATAEAVVDVGDITARPRYIIELMQVNVPESGQCTTSGDVSLDAQCSANGNRYRITARSKANDRSEVILQSIYAVP